jgi:tetratricopeptide (TPR) repeat protein
LGFSSSASAAADVPPKMSCKYDPDEMSVPGFISARPIDRPKPIYPKEALNEWSEGWVQLEYAIGSDGVVHGIAAVDAVGPKDFVTSSQRAIAKWRYAPATRNGAAVEQSLYRVSVLYLFSDSRRTSEHQEFVTKYNRARRYVREQKFDQAIETLERALKSRTNLYEMAMGSYLLAVAYANKGDWPRALLHIRHAVIADLDYLEKPLWAPALALQVELETRDGSLMEALCARDKLQSVDPASAAPESPVGKIVKRIETALKDPGPLVSEARLTTNPLFEAPAVWRHRLMRSKFSFAEIKGEVKSFRLACVGTSHEAAVDIETRWDVPAGAGPCMLRVDGAPDAAFKLVEEW